MCITPGATCIYAVRTLDAVFVHLILPVGWSRCVGTCGMKTSQTVCVHATPYVRMQTTLICLISINGRPRLGNESSSLTSLGRQRKTCQLMREDDDDDNDADDDVDSIRMDQLKGFSSSRYLFARQGIFVSSSQTHTNRVGWVDGYQPTTLCARGLDALF